MGHFTLVIFKIFLTSIKLHEIQACFLIMFVALIMQNCSFISITGGHKDFLSSGNRVAFGVNMSKPSIEKLDAIK